MLRACSGALEIGLRELSSCTNNAQKKNPSLSKGPRRGQRRRAQHCRKQWSSSVSATTKVAAAESRLEALQREVARSDIAPSTASRSDGLVVKRCRREDFVPHCNEEMQEMDAGASCRSPSGRCGRTSPGSGESFPAPHHCCSGVVGAMVP